jgi:hypothetical protein
MPPVAVFRANTPHVVHEIIDGEAILVNMQTGRYYSASEIGAVVWGLIEAGAPVSAIVDRVAARYRGAREEIAAGIERFLAELEREGLIVPHEGAVAVGDGAGAGRDVPPAGAPFVPPALRAYTDMEDLLLLDPIHDVDETGWPNRAKDRSD